QLDVFGPQPDDRGVHVVAIETAQELPDDRIIVVAIGEAGDPGFASRADEPAQVPVEHGILPLGPRRSVVSQRKLIQLRGSEIPLQVLGRRMLGRHQPPPASTARPPTCPPPNIGDSRRAIAVATYAAANRAQCSAGTSGASSGCTSVAISPLG